MEAILKYDSNGFLRGKVVNVKKLFGVDVRLFDILPDEPGPKAPKALTIQGFMREREERRLNGGN